MKKFVLILIVLSSGLCAQAFYDFCESPQDYNTFPASYDFKTEYWTDIPNYNSEDVKYVRKENKKEKPAVIKKSAQTGDTVIKNEEDFEN